MGNSSLVKHYFAKNIANHTKNDWESYADLILWPIEEFPWKVKECKISDLKAEKVIPFAASALYAVPMLFYPKETSSLTLKSIVKIPFIPTWVAKLASCAVTITAIGYIGLKTYEYIQQKPYEQWENLKAKISQQARSLRSGFNIVAIALGSLYLLSLAFYPKRTTALTTKSAFSILYPPVYFWKLSALLLSTSVVAGYSLRAYGRFTNPELKNPK